MRLRVHREASTDDPIGAFAGDPTAPRGCTVHPPGETEERRAALEAGRPFAAAVERRQVPDLPDHPTPDDLVSRALLSNADLEQKYWAWRSAIEQVPQDGTQATNLALSAGLDITRGRIGQESATLGLGNDPMADLVLPPKLSTAARRALENARAAGLRFRKAQFELRAKVLGAYAEYALTAELARIEESNVGLLQTTVMVVEARNRAGAAGQQDLLRARNELDLSRNELAGMRARNPGRTRGAERAARPRAGCPHSLAGADADISSRRAGMTRRYFASRRGTIPSWVLWRKRSPRVTKASPSPASSTFPTFHSARAPTWRGSRSPLPGWSPSPSCATRRSTPRWRRPRRTSGPPRRCAGRRGTTWAHKSSWTSRPCGDADRQLALFAQTVLPRARQVVTVARSAYEAGQSSLLDVLEAQRSLLAIERLVANLRATREKRLADLEAATGTQLTCAGTTTHPASQS